MQKSTLLRVELHEGIITAATMLMNELRQRPLHDQRTLLACTRLVAALILGISLFTSIVPFAPLMPDVGLDPSWMHALNEANSQHMVIGRAIMTTFGPYAALFSYTYHPRTDGLILVVSLALASAYLLIALVALRGRIGGSYLFAALFFALAALDRNIIFFSLPLLLALAIQRLTTPEDPETPSTASLRLLNLLVVAGAMTTSVLCLSKLSMIPYSWVMLALCAIWLIHRKQAPSATLLLVSYVAGLLSFWLVAGQSLADLPHYFANAWEIISGYTDAMSFQGPALEWTVYLAIAALTLALMWVEHTDAKQSRLFLGLVAASCYFFCFKAGFTRQDGLVFNQTSIVLSGHVGTAALALLLLGLCAPVFFASQARQWIVGLLGLLGCALIVAAYGPANPDVAARHILATQAAALDGLRSRLGITPTPSARYAQRIAMIGRQLDLPDIGGNWDLYSYDQSLLLAHDPQWKPRPAFQSYLAYTPALLQANAEHLQGHDAPDNIVFKVQPIDNRYPALDDGVSWPYLMGLYVPARRLDHDFLLLERRPPGDPRSRAALPAYQSANVIRFGQRVEMPAGSDLRYARLHFKKTLAGKIMSVLYKTPTLMMQVELANGRVATYRLVPMITEAGFLMSPLIDSAEKFAFAATGQLDVLEPDKVVAFTLLTGERGDLAWRDGVELSLSAPQ